MLPRSTSCPSGRRPWSPGRVSDLVDLIWAVVAAAAGTAKLTEAIAARDAIATVPTRMGSSGAGAGGGGSPNGKESFLIC
ncbi:hypothetical protein GCM10018954_052510 [Kutzneria kofuensis]